VCSRGKWPRAEDPVHGAQPRAERHGRGQFRPAGVSCAARSGRADMAAEHDDSHRPGTGQPQRSACRLGARTRCPGVIKQGHIRAGEPGSVKSVSAQVPGCRVIMQAGAQRRPRESEAGSHQRLQRMRRGAAPAAGHHREMSGPGHPCRAPGTRAVVAQEDDEKRAQGCPRLGGAWPGRLVQPQVACVLTALLRMRDGHYRVGEQPGQGFRMQAALEAADGPPADRALAGDAEAPAIRRRPGEVRRLFPHRPGQQLPPRTEPGLSQWPCGSIAAAGFSPRGGLTPRDCPFFGGIPGHGRQGTAGRRRFSRPARQTGARRDR